MWIFSSDSDSVLLALVREILPADGVVWCSVYSAVDTQTLVQVYSAVDTQTLVQVHQPVHSNTVNLQTSHNTPL